MGNPKKGTRSLWGRTAASVIACSTTLSIVTTVSAPIAGAQSSDWSAAALVTALSDAQSRVDAINLNMGDLRESVNRALVDLHDAQSRAEQMRRGVEEARQRLAETQAAVDAARRELADVARLQYRAQGAPTVLAGGAADQKDVLDRSLYVRQQVEEKQARLAEVERARTAAANEESTLREASRLADEAAAEAAQAEEAARASLDSSEQELTTYEAEREKAAAEVDEAKQQLDQVRPSAADEAADETGESTESVEPSAPEAQSLSTPDVPEATPEMISAVRERIAEEQPDAPEPSEEAISYAVSTALLAGEQGESADDPEVQAAAIAATAAVIGSSQAEHASLEDPYVGGSSDDVIAAFSKGFASVVASRETVSPDVADVLPVVEDAVSVTETLTTPEPETTSEDETEEETASTPNSALVETVIARAQSMVGTPYVWGGGDANGPTAGLNGGGIRGFDCSGLVLYAFAAAGISLPHYTGYQYQRGTQVDPSDAQRGDLLFWGPNGSQHVAIYLGDGMMIEAPQSGQNVQVTSVRWSGMADKAVRLL
ncbi:DIP1281 family NlpC/P60 protein [Corynebacterium sp.]|uniref:DIP1281 family NlpC/P60 protein n=1 Tax=Corynebacterium sp. TaxID=1720 RepID=UPI0039C858F9